GGVRRIEEDQRREQHDHGHGLGQQRETQEKDGGARIVAPHPSERAVDPHETSLKSHSRHLRVGLAIWDGTPLARWRRDASSLSARRLSSSPLSQFDKSPTELLPFLAITRSPAIFVVCLGKRMVKGSDRISQEPRRFEFARDRTLEPPHATHRSGKCQGHL